MPVLARESAKVRCSHKTGYARPKASRPFLTIASVPVLVDRDLHGNAIKLCPNLGPTTKPCKTTLPLVAGQSGFVFSGGAPVVFGRATGATDGIPPGATTWTVIDPDQDFVHASG